jgi:hypothetical protein
MKKLFTMALGALLVIGLAACNNGKKEEEPAKEKTAEDFSADVIADGTNVYGMVGPASAYIDGQAIPKAWGDADGTFGLAKAVSLRDVAKKDIALAEAFEAKGLKGLYAVEKVQLGHDALAGYMKGAYNEKGEYVEADGCFTIKFAKYTLDDLTEKYAIDTWIPSPEAYSESLTPKTWWAPLHKEAKDEHGLAHDSDCVNLGGAGEYTYFLGVYKKAVGDSFFGIGVIKDKALDPYVAPQALSEYAMPGQWNGWDNSGLKATSAMEKVNDTTYKMTVTAAAGDNGRIVESGSWNTVGDVTKVTVGADLVEDDNGGDHNFKFLAAGSYTVTLKLGDTVAVEIVAA